MARFLKNVFFVQVKVGPNGEIIVDEESTIIETSASKKAKEDLLKAPLVFESANQVVPHFTRHTPFQIIHKLL